MVQRTVLSSIVVIGAFLGCPAMSAGVITLSVFPSSQNVALGSPMNVSLRITGLGNQTAPSLGTFDLNLDFDPAILSFSSVVFGDPILGDLLDPTGLENTFDFTNPGFGTVELFDLSLDSARQLNTLQPGSFVLGSLVFDTIGVGTSSLNLTVNSLGDADGNALSANVQNGSADVNAVSSVPEPNSGLLLLTGAAIVMVIRMRWSYRRS